MRIHLRFPPRSRPARSAVAALALLAGCAAPRTPTPAPAPGTVSLEILDADAATSLVRLEKCLPRAVAIGTELAYEIRVENLTGRTLEHVVVSERLSPHVEIARQSPLPSVRDGVARYTIEHLAPRASAWIRIAGVPQAKEPVVSCTSVGDVRWLCATTQVLQPALQVAAAAPAEAALGEAFAIEFTLSNPGDADAAGVVLLPKLADGLVARDGAGLLFDLGVLAPAETRRVTVFVRASSAGSYACMAEARGARALSAASNTVATQVR